MAPQCHPKEKRAFYLRVMLQPENLLPRLEAATEPGRPYADLIGIKDSATNWQELREIHGPAFRAEVEGDPEISAMLDKLRKLGFEFGWGGYSEPAGEEVTLHIQRNPEAEARLRELIATRKD